jgi:hypothetical protein
MAHKTHTLVCEEVHRINEARATSFKLQWWPLLVLLESYSLGLPRATYDGYFSPK